MTRLPLGRHYTPRDGHPDWNALADEAHELAERLRPTLAPPDPAVIDWSRKLRSYATTARNYRRNRALARAGREDLRPLYFIWTTQRACNFACTYCDDHRGQRYPDLPDDDTLDTEGARRLLRVMRKGTPSIYFAGGEPTLRPDFPELTDLAYELSYYPIVTNTNGSALHGLLRKPTWKRWLARTDIIVVSLDALDLQMLETMWGYRRPRDVMRNLLLLRELASEMRVKLMVNAVIQPGRVQHARDVLDLANDLGIWFCPVPQNVGPRVSSEVQEDAEYRELCEVILERQRQGLLVTGSPRLTRRLLEGAPLDCRNTLKPHVDHDGALMWPCKASVNVSPERINVLDYDDVDSLYSAATRRIDPTRFHGPGPEQCGANCNWAQNYSTDAYAHGLAHPTSLMREMVSFLRAR